MTVDQADRQYQYQCIINQALSTKNVLQIKFKKM